MPDRDWDDIELRGVSDHSAPAAPTTRGLVWAIAVLVAAATVAAYFAFLAPSGEPVAQLTAPARAAPPPVSSRSLGGLPDRVDVPPLDQSDAAVRRLVADLSAASIVQEWVNGKGLIRNFVAVAVNLEEGSSPAKLLPRLRPTGVFRVVERDGRAYIDARSYQRYDAAADAIVALDPSRVARLYATLKPRIEEAFRALGFPDRTFDRVLQAVIVTFVRTPIPDDHVAVRRKGLRYVYVDGSFEDLTSAQKQFLRLGPRSVRRVDDWLRRLADALGIPAAAFSAP